MAYLGLTSYFLQDLIIAFIMAQTVFKEKERKKYRPLQFGDIQYVTFSEAEHS